MKCFLTSSLLIPNTEEINPANRFFDALKECVLNPCKAVFVCSDPVHHEKPSDLQNQFKQRSSPPGLILTNLRFWTAKIKRMQLIW